LSILIILTEISSVKATVDFNDGQQHIIDYAIDDGVMVDWHTPDAGTEVTIRDGAVISMDLWACYSSKVTISGGELNGLVAFDSSFITCSAGSFASSLYATDSSQIYFLGGSINSSLKAEDSSFVMLSGGDIENDLDARDSSWVTVSGGTIGDDIFAGFYFREHTSLINFVGSDFKINGASIGYGVFASDYAIYGTDPYGNPCLTGILTGTLANGDTLNNTFYIFDNADITFTPEPSTLFLLGLGAVILRKRKK